MDGGGLPIDILIVSPFARDAARGNSIAAARLAAGFRARGHRVAALNNVSDPALVPDGLAFAVRAAGAVDVALILHAARCTGVATVLRESGTPYVVAVRGTDANEMLRDAAQAEAIRSVLAGAARITVFGVAMRRQLQRHVASVMDRVRLVPNGLSMPVSQVDYRAELRLGEDALVFVCLAGLRAVKRPLFPVEHLAPLAREARQIRFVHAGPALERETATWMREAAAEHAWVVDAGEIPHTNVDSFLRAADVFVSASRSEGMPHAVREAMRCGLPLLLSDIAGHRAMAEPEREALFFRDAGEFQAAARRLIADDALRKRLGEAAGRRIERELAETDEIGAYLALLDECRGRC